MEQKYLKQEVIAADCLSYLQDHITDQTIDVIVTSPPYNIGIQYNQYKDDLPRLDYLKWLNNVGQQLKRVLKDDGSFFLNCGSTNVDPWLSMDIANVLRDLFVPQNHILWVKSISIDDDTIGHFKPINSKRFLNHNHESIFHFTKTGDVEVDRLAIGVPFKDKTNIARRGHKQDKRCAGNVWYIPYETVQNKSEKYNHPAGYPVELAKKCIALHNKNKSESYVSGLMVLDPFVGTGTTLVAAKQMGHNGLGIDIDQTYVDIAKKRLDSKSDLILNGSDWNRY